MARGSLKGSSEAQLAKKSSLVAPRAQRRPAQLQLDAAAAHGNQLAVVCISTASQARQPADM